MSAALSWETAREAARDAASRLPAERVPLAEALGRVLAAEVRAGQDVPHYASSAMDGWAVAGEGPWSLVDTADLRDGQAALIATGGVMPTGARGVIRREFATVRDGRLVLASDAPESEVRRGRHVRPAGEEAHAGELVIRVGARLNPAHLAVAAACGADELLVVRRPRVALVLTGDEIVVRGLPGPGRVRDSFGPQLPGMLALLGADVVEVRHVGDDPAATATALGSRVDLVVSTGGTGGSHADHLRSALAARGAELLVPRVAIRPGGPTLLARLPGGALVLGLPGNPLAAMLGLLGVGGPLLARLGGPAEAAPIEVRATTSVAGRPDSTRLVPVRRAADGVAPARWIDAGMMRGLAEADGVLIVPPEGIAAGATARMLPLPWA